MTVEAESTVTNCGLGKRCYRSFARRSDFEDTVFADCHVGAFWQKYLMQNVLLGQKIDWSLSQEREFMGVTGNKIAEDKKVDKAVAQ